MPEFTIEADEVIDFPERGPGALKPALLSGLVLKAIPVRDNTEFVTKFDKDTFKGVVAKPTKTVVVDQDPDPGDFVPAGIPINVTLTVKEVIPVGSFKGIETAVASKYVNIGALQVDLEKPGDTEAQAAKSVLDKKADYNALSTNDKQAVDTFMKNRFGEQTVDTEEKKAKIYNDMKFLVHL